MIQQVTLALTETGMKVKYVKNNKIRHQTNNKEPKTDNKEPKNAL